MANNYLSIGSMGTSVKELQDLLTKNGYAVDRDGIYGPKTEAAVKAYQKATGLKVDGLAGVQTMGSLKDILASEGKLVNKGDAKATDTGSDVPAVVPTSTGGTTLKDELISKGEYVSIADLKAAGTTGGDVTTVVTPSTGGTSTGTGNATGGNAAASTNTFTYDPFQPSQSTQDADKKRQELQSQKPGDFSYADYTPSEIVQQANALLQQQLANKPGDYISQYADQMQALMDQYLNRDKFSYDMNGDALYRQYADQYQLMGQQAMMDTMGQAQAMTGGYGNSYAQSVGQQAYQGYLQKLNEVVPQLYQMAYDRYNQEGQDMLNQYGLLSNQDEMEYGRYRDQVSDYYTELNRLTEDARYKSEDDYGKYMDKYNMAYGQYRDSVSDWQSELDRADSEYWNQYSADYGQYSDDRNLNYDNYWNEKDMAYQQERDKASDDKWAQEFEYQKYRDSVSDQRYESEQAAAAAAAAAKASETNYADFGGEVQEYWANKFERAESLEDVERIGDQMDQAKIDPAIVYDWVMYYAAKFKDKEPEPKPAGKGTGVYGGIGGGGGGGVTMIELK